MSFKGVVGEHLTSDAISVRLDVMGEYTRAVAEPGYERNIHNDAEVARRYGLEEPIAEGRMWTTLLSAMLASALGPAWLSAGSFAVNFTRMVKAGDRITGHAVVTGSEAEPGGRRIRFEVWCENQRGEKVMVGTASCLVPGE